MRSTSRTLAARSKYEQLRLSVTPAYDGRRFVVLWFKAKHQEWQYSHIVGRYEYQAVPGMHPFSSMLSAAVDACEEALEAEHRAGRSRR